MRPFVDNEDARCERQFEGGHHGAEKLLLRCAWSPDRERVACGSADRYLLSICLSYWTVSILLVHGLS